MTNLVGRTRSYVAANASQPVLEQTLGDALRLAGKTWPLKPALIQGALETSERRKWTFQDLVEQSEQVARALLSRFEPGDWTCPAFVESVFDFTLPALRTEAG